MSEFLKAAIPFYRKKHLLDERPLHFDLARYHATQTPLRFPGKITADEQSRRLFISDSNHNRIVVAGLDGKLIATIGSGAAGRADGNFSTAEFNRPQGLALRRRHALRCRHRKPPHPQNRSEAAARRDNRRHRAASRVRLPRRQCRSSSAATARLPKRFVGPARQTAISSPWDVLVHGKDLFIAMAGTHQIWKLPLNESEIGPYAGNSREDIVDGPLLPRQPFATGFASFAQPSGLATDGHWLFVADSEGSSIRAVPLVIGGHSEVHTVIGTAELPSERLFTFGDVDGMGAKIRFQHPLGMVYHNGLIYLADTYNNKIKAIDPERRTATTIAGAGPAGHDDAASKPGDAATFNEPGGIAYAAGKLYVADTNNHLIRVISLEGDHQVGTLTIDGLEPPAAAKVDTAKADAKPAAETKPSFKGAEQVAVAAAKVKPSDGAVHLAVRFELPDGWKINTLAPMRYWIESTAPAGPLDRVAFGKFHKLDHPAASFDVRLPVKQSTGSETITLSMNYYYCQEGENGVCKTGSVVWTVPLELSSTGSAEPVPVSLTVK